MQPLIVLGLVALGFWLASRSATGEKSGTGAGIRTSEPLLGGVRLPADKIQVGAPPPQENVLKSDDTGMFDPNFLRGTYPIKIREVDLAGGWELEVPEVLVGKTEAVAYREQEAVAVTQQETIRPSILASAPTTRADWPVYDPIEEPSYLSPTKAELLDRPLRMF